jgi:hypothetical protein
MFKTLKNKIKKNTKEDCKCDHNFKFIYKSCNFGGKLLHAPVNILSTYIPANTEQCKINKSTSFDGVPYKSVIFKTIRSYKDQSNYITNTVSYYDISLIIAVYYEMEKILHNNNVCCVYDFYMIIKDISSEFNITILQVISNLLAELNTSLYVKIYENNSVHHILGDETKKKEYTIYSSYKNDVFISKKFYNSQKNK